MCSSSHSINPRKKTYRKHQRIKTACLELELAFKNFEDNTEAHERARSEAQKIKEIRRQLLIIKRQLDDL
ncbi:MAG: hypothetical protein A2Z20_08490 [Bdellovibrionales bacterium RBG_16_40_8]|nr:MAG: hypothetical protein A2Z20_08490 [Bdellovibrionales bacterium RBG_16_40_8]